jgi:hypothetical protein
MGEYSEPIAASSRDGETGLCSCEAHHVGISTQEDRGGTKGTVGEDTGAGKEGGISGSK